jgi:hypothetical protein
VTPRGATALDLLATLAPPAPRGGPADIMPPRRLAQWCDRCGAPRNLGRRDCPGCALLDRARERLSSHIARHGVPAGGALELTRAADVPLRVVGELIAPGPGARRRGRQGIVRTAR